MSVAADRLAVEQVPIERLSPHPRNPRRGDVDAIAESLRVNGQYKPIVVQRSTGHVLAGNHTLAAAQKLGWPTIAAVHVDVGDEEAVRILLADNRTSDLASYSEPDLAAALQFVPDLTGTGFDSGYLERLLSRLPGEAPSEPPTPEPPADPVTQPGDLIELGRHRLVCGDALVEATYRRALPRAAQLLFTDPPYGLKYRDRGRSAEWMRNRDTSAIVPRFEPMEGDDLDGDDLLAFLIDSLGAATAACEPTAAIYVWHAPTKAALVEQAVGAIGYVIRSPIVWAKSKPTFNPAQYKFRHECAFYAFRAGHAPKWYGDRTETTVWEHGTDWVGYYEHPTQKPVALAEHALRNSSQAGDVVLDPFVGSGTTLLAAERLDRVCAAIEISPAYCDVVVSRWEQLTGERAKRPKRRSRAKAAA